MPLYKCLYSHCQGYKQEIDVPSYMQPNCPSCGKWMASAEQPEAPVVLSPSFLAAAQKVADRMGNKYANSYQRNVVEDLKGRAPFFQKDFQDEMNRNTELRKFCGETPRPPDADKICVDNALDAVNYAFPIDLPRGEKFTFEVPYIMHKAGWEFMNGRADIFASNFTELYNRVETDTMYLVCAKQTSNEIGHMVVLIVGNSKSQAWLTDAQKQPNNYGVYRYVAWKYGAAPATRPTPYRPIDLQTGKFQTGSSWVNS